MESSMVQPPAGDSLVREVSLPLFQTKGWIRFLGVMSIVQAVVLLAMSMGFGIIYAWLPIWIGIILFQAAGAMEAAYKTQDKYQLIAANSKIKLYFIIQGVTTLIGIAFGIIMLFFVGFGALLGAFSSEF